MAVGLTHIDALVSAGLANGQPVPLVWPVPDTNPPWYDELTLAMVNQVGSMLLAANERSVSGKSNEPSHLTGWVRPYRFRRLPGVPPPVPVLKAIACLEYQSCEDPNWQTSEASAYCEALRLRVINFLPGYADAPAWPITSRDAFTTPTAKAGDVQVVPGLRDARATPGLGRRANRIGQPVAGEAERYRSLTCPMAVGGKYPRPLGVPGDAQ